MSNDSASRFAAIELDSAIPAPMTNEATERTGVVGLSTPRYAVHNGLTSLQEVYMSVPELLGTVEKERMYTLRGEAVPGQYASVRTMPNGTRQMLGTVGERYKVVQDREAFDIVGPLMDAGIIKTVNAGSHKAKTWLYGEAGINPIEVVPGDAIEARILVGNSHDGSIPWCVGWPGNRVVCQNTFRMAVSSKVSRLLKLRHSGNVVELVSAAKEAIAAVGMDFVTTADKFKYLASKKCNADDLKEYTGYVFSKWADTDDDEQTESAGGRVYNRILENFESGQGADLSRGTYWGAFNAVTEYLTHQRGRGTSEARFTDLQWGAGAGLNTRAMDGAMQLAGG